MKHRLNVAFTPQQRYYWIFLCNMWKDANDPSQYWTGSPSILERAAAAGYTHVLTHYVDTRHSLTDTHPTAEELNNLKTLKSHCDSLGLGMICSVSSSLAPHTYAADVIYVEDCPVIEAPFIVSGGSLVPVNDVATAFPGMQERLNFAFLPEWDSGAIYSISSQVQHESVVYTCIKYGVSVLDPATDTERWTADTFHWWNGWYPTMSSDDPITGVPVGMSQDFETIHSDDIDNFSIKIEGPYAWMNIFQGTNHLDETIQGVTPYRYWHLSFWIKLDHYEATSSYGPGFWIRPMSNENTGNKWYEKIVTQRGFRGSKPQSAPPTLLGIPWPPEIIVPITRDWTQCHLSFNTLDRMNNYSMYLFFFMKAGGTMWIDDIVLEPAGIANIIRKSEALTPVVVTSEDGETTYDEGIDYDGASDPNSYPVRRETWHYDVGAPLMTVPVGSSLSEAQTVLVSYHVVPYQQDGHTYGCFGSEELLALNKLEIDTIESEVNPDGYFVWLDELRFCGWDTACAAKGDTAGKVIAAYLRDRTDYIKEVAPGKIIGTFSDMVDRFLNAGVADVYCNKGTCFGSWKGLDADVIVTNWHLDQSISDDFGLFVGYAGTGPIENTYAVRSLKFVAQITNNQLYTGYYEDLRAWPPEIVLNESGPYKVSGAVYFTWVNTYYAVGSEDGLMYGTLEDFITRCKAILEPS